MDFEGTGFGRRIILCFKVKVIYPCKVPEGSRRLRLQDFKTVGT
jgi:hypothetical protein